MNREKILFLIAILMIVLPHLGLTNLMEQITFFVLGLVVMIFAYGIYFENRNKQTKSTTPVVKKSHVGVHREPGFRPIAQTDETNGFKVVKKDSPKVEENNFHI